MSDVSLIVSQIDDGDLAAADQLFSLVYAELRQLATARMQDERSGHTLSPTALVHEAYVRLVDRSRAEHWNGRRHFFSAAAEAMRRILIEHSRRKNAAKRGGAAKRIDLEPADLIEPSRGRELIDLDEALGRLEQTDAEAAEMVKLRFFAGLSNQQSSEEMGISPRKGNMLWAYARAWLRRAVENRET